MEKGKYIVIEGGEGCGKTTQAKLLIAYLESRRIECEYGREPGSTPEAEQIRNILLNKDNNLPPLTEVFLFQAARNLFFERDLIPKLERGITIVSDRSFYSTLAYQGHAGGIDLGKIEAMSDLATLRTRHDLAFILDVEASRGLSKEENADRFAAKGSDYHEKVNEGFREIARTHSNTVLIPYIDNGVHQMQTQIREYVYRLF